MAPSKNAAELCALLVDETYGELASRIFTMLLRRGRQPIPSLSRNTRLTPRQIRHGLAVLIQQNLIYHHPDRESGITYYEANPDAAYSLVRSGKIMNFVESRYGAVAREVIHNLLLLGHTKISDLVEAYEAKQRENTNGKGVKQHTNGINGHGKAPIVLTGQLHAVLLQLIEAGLVERVIEHSFRSPGDTYEALEIEALKKFEDGVAKGARGKLELEDSIRQMLQELRSRGPEWRPSQSKKRPYNGDHTNGVNGTSKRRRLSNSGGAVNGDHIYEDDGFRHDPGLVIRINHEKCSVILRNLQLVDFARDRIGTTTSQIYAELLRLLEDRTMQCKPDFEHNGRIPTVSTIALESTLSESLNVGFGIGKATPEKDNAPVPNGTKRRASELEDNEIATNGYGKQNGVNGDASGEDDDPFASLPAVKAGKQSKVTFEDSEAPLKALTAADRHNRTLQIKNHLKLLEADECGFITKEGIEGGGSWSVNFEKIVKKMQDVELDRILLENFGQTGHRMARMMRKKGKLDEKQIPNQALMKQKDVRTKLAEMQMAGVVDIQEIPKDASNRSNNARTIFLWYFDSERVTQVIVDKIYKAMSRLLQRLAVERREAQSVLEITERSDVRDHAPEEYLEPTELEKLHAIRRKEEALLGQVGRLDGLIGIFRDY